MKNKITAAVVRTFATSTLEGAKNIMNAMAEDARDHYEGADPSEQHKLANKAELFEMGAELLEVVSKHTPQLIEMLTYKEDEQ